jgi:hypothetical protein
MAHPVGGKNNDRRNVRLKNLQSIINLSFVGNDHAYWGSALSTLDSGFLQFSRQTEPHIVAS